MKIKAKISGSGDGDIFSYHKGFDLGASGYYDGLRKFWKQDLSTRSWLSSKPECRKKKGQVLGSLGVTKTREGMRKRLKISVPHFDNSALIKTFSKTLIGRCMNPEAQDMKALLGNLPKIWKVEDRVTGTDLGFGKFQFDFEVEEDIETILKLQPFHFDYLMLAIERWQPKTSQTYPS
ncbi:uncharacterized protein LOC108817230 [Raphanus sativus]|uniref:Uncharacterized protein LOC108817230 n=1 Tax=Raphanus sativus TaxID=3726 RepID=A0A6J0KCZ3_RAPSA|nr:uncharacterized protein LOC108817230 [Raphanus sativus]